MKHLFPVLLTGALFAAACAPVDTSPPASEHGGHMQEPAGEARDLTVQDQSTDAQIAFSVREGDTVFQDYGVSHTKEMHLIVVRDDLRHFQHLHPERNAQGVWSVPFSAPAGGDYWLYADFVNAENATHTIRFERTYLGAPGTHGIVKQFDRVKTVDGYRFELKPAVQGDTVTFAYTVTDAQGRNVELEEYLGATGHSVLISPSSDFIHTHPSDDGQSPVFATTMPTDDFYRIFTQFKINGKVVTVDFDWQV
jgi:hypothetical protein